jgi:hypothetical protein
MIFDRSEITSERCAQIEEGTRIRKLISENKTLKQDISILKAENFYLQSYPTLGNLILILTGGAISLAIIYLLVGLHALRIF